MRRSERAITDAAELEAILRKAAVVTLAMVDDGRAYAVPMNFGYAQGCLYLHGAKDGRKMDLLRRNPLVSFSLYCDEEVVPGGAKGCRWTSRYRSVIGEGRVEMLEDEPSKRKAFDILLKHWGPGPFVYDESTIERTCVFRVVVTSMTGKKAD
jgi:uncharacterized protein